MKIVLVDPSRVILKVTAGYLAPAGYDVVPYTDATMALERIRADVEVEVLVTSLEPHGMTGLDLCREARRVIGSRRALHVIVMSSSSEGRHVVEALDSGADDFMGKPPAPEEFLARLRVAKRSTTLQRELIRLATIDGLTGIANRRAFFEISGERERAAEPISVALFDIDRFKQVNDVYGHAAGDAVISAVAGASLGCQGVAGRIGGEEFALLFEGMRLGDAVEACERLRETIQELRFPAIQSELVVSCSFGVVERQPSESVEDALKRADVALYAAKSAGRNRVIAATKSAGTAGAVGIEGAPRLQRVRA